MTKDLEDLIRLTIVLGGRFVASRVRIGQTYHTRLEMDAKGGFAVEAPAFTTAVEIYRRHLEDFEDAYRKG